MRRTSEDSTIDTIDHDYSESPENGRSNVLAAIKAKRRSTEKIKTGDEKLLREISQLDGDLVMRYKYVPMDVSQKASAKIKNLPESLQLYYSSCDVLVLACEEILLKVGYDENDKANLQPLEGEGADPVNLKEYRKLGDFLAELCDDEKEADLVREAVCNSRAACLELFQSEYAVIAEAQRVSEWMQTLKKSAEETMLGESNGAERQKL